jgi:hypothetical protein
LSRVDARFTGEGLDLHVGSKAYGPTMSTTYQIAEVADRSAKPDGAAPAADVCGDAGCGCGNEAGVAGESEPAIACTLEVGTGGVALEVRAPSEAIDIVTALFGAPA